MTVSPLLIFEFLALNLWIHAKCCDACQNNDSSVIETTEMVAPPHQEPASPPSTVSCTLITTGGLSIGICCCGYAKPARGGIDGLPVRLSFLVARNRGSVRARAGPVRPSGRDELRRRPACDSRRGLARARPRGRRLRSQRRRVRSRDDPAGPRRLLRPRRQPPPRRPLRGPPARGGRAHLFLSGLEHGLSSDPQG